MKSAESELDIISYNMISKMGVCTYMKLQQTFNNTNVAANFIE